jgi:hypothetical protein
MYFLFGLNCQAFGSLFARDVISGHLALLCRRAPAMIHVFCL